MESGRLESTHINISRKPRANRSYSLIPVSDHLAVHHTHAYPRINASRFPSLFSVLTAELKGAEAFNVLKNRLGIKYKFPF